MSENQDLLARIGQLAGHINLHKAQTPPSQSTTHTRPSASSVARGHASWKPPRPAPYQMAQGRGRGAYRPYSRNRSLIMNNGRSQSPAPRALDSSATAPTTETPQPSAAYVTTTGRHKQYINASVLGKVTEQRKRAIQESQQYKAQQHDQWERQRMHQYVAALDAERNGSIPQGSSYSSGREHEIKIDGLSFQVLKGGSKLVRIFDCGQRPKEQTFKGLPLSAANKAISIDLELFAPARACRKKNCDLPHVDRAGQIRKHAAQSAEPNSGVDSLEISKADDSDISSDEDDFVDTEGDDVDSDDLDDEFIAGVNDTGHQQLAQQDDFVQLIGKS
ncbi:MAG: hypothetical protein Q9213_000453 [Squamulea squamosa]